MDKNDAVGTQLLYMSKVNTYSPVLTLSCAFAAHRTQTAPRPYAPYNQRLTKDTMTVSYSRALHCADRQDDYALYSSTNTPSYRAEPAPDMPSQTVQPMLQDPYTYYRAFQGTNAPSSNNPDELAQVDDGYTCHTRTIGPQDRNALESQQQIRARAIPYHLAVRFANRSNGAPLSTIIEQGSYSTLNSRSSLLSVGRFPSTRVAENTSPGRHRVSRSLDENPLQRIQEDAPQEQDPPAATIEAHARPQGRGRSRPVFDTTTPMKTNQLSSPRSPRSQLDDAEHGSESNKPKGFLRGVLHNVRAASRTRSRSSSMTQASAVEARDDRQETSDNSPPCQMPGYNYPRHETNVENSVGLRCTQEAFASTPYTPIAGSHARSRKTPLTNPQTPATSYPPSVESSLPLFEPSSTFGNVPHLWPSSTATRSRERSSSVRLVTPEPRDVAYVDATAGAPTLSNHHNDNTLAQHTFDGVSVHKHSAFSLGKHDPAREASRNASFCSTMSTSYSGTVLGVDLDLQYETPQAARQSSSPMPV